MSEASITMGRILSYGKDDHEHNLNFLENLPSQDDGNALFTREMFCQNKLQGKMSFVVGFARSYKNVESYWKDWITQFENILSQLKWDSVNVILETEMFGTHQYMWMNKYYPNGTKKENSYELLEKEEWYFGKGFRNFWGTPQLDLGFDKTGNEVRTIKSFIDAIDKSIDGKPARFKIFEDKTGKLKFLSSSNGLKKFVSEILKHYVNLSVENTNWSSQRYDVLNDIVHEDSPKQIKEISLSSSYLNTEWIYEFVDKNLKEE